MHGVRVVFRKFASNRELYGYLRKLGNTPEGSGILSKKGNLLFIEIKNIDTRGANILKQDALSVGADCAVPREASSFSVGFCNVLLITSERNLEKLLAKLKIQPFGLEDVAQEIEEGLKKWKRENFKISYNGKVLNLETPIVMGILNVTPDSFSDGGKYFSLDSAVRRCEEMLEEGAKIIDIGGESTRPGAEPVSLEEEIRRVVPVIKEIRKRFGDDFFISVDTYKSEVAKLSLEEGADMINDVSALRFDENMVNVVARYECPVVLMHMRGTPKTMQENPTYDDVVGEILNFLKERIEFAVNFGVKEENIIVDPGIGFGKTVEHNLCILKRLCEFKVLGLPIMIGTSRKSFIGAITEESEPEKRLAGSLATYGIAVENGAKIIRVHDVKETVDFLKVFLAVKGADCL